MSTTKQTIIMSKAISFKNIDLNGIRTGDRKAFEQVYFEFYDVLFHLSLQYLQEEALSEEIVQDAFMKLWEVRENLKDDSNIKNYLYTITKNNCLSQLRKVQVIQHNVKDIHYLEMQFNYEALTSLPDDYLQFDELKDKIEQAIDALPDDLKAVFIMNRFEDLKYREIADQLHLSVKTIEARMSKALVILRKELKEYLPVITLIASIFD